MKRILYVANWKANPKTLKEAEKEISLIKKQKPKYADLIVCPPYPFLQSIAKSNISLGAQNVSICKEGPHTGEITASMIKSVGAGFCIVGHSERRALGETSQEVSMKMKALFKIGIKPILCIGEHSRGGDGEHFQEITKILTNSLEGLSKQEIKHVIVAYEPVWAISSEHNGAIDPHMLEETTIFIKKVLKDLTGEKVVTNKILYGGSVDSKNIKSFLLSGVDGFLIGKMSLKASSLVKIMQIKAND